MLISSDKTSVKGSDVLRQLQHRGRRSWTGALRCRVPGMPLPASIYLYEGGVYALDLPWYRPRVIARLISAGIVDATRQAILDSTVGRDADHGEAARFCVAQGWLSAERLGAIHSEFTLAGLGAIQDLDLDISAEDGAVTGQFCMLPVAYADLESALEVRAERNGSAWAFTQPPAATVVARAMPAVVPDHQMPEVLACLDALDHPMGLDVLAGRCGFTRAEAAFIVAALAVQGVVMLTPGAPEREAQVPEAVPSP